MTDRDKSVIRDGVSALRRVASLTRQTPQMVETARTPLVLRDFEGLAHRLEEPEGWEWDLGKEFAFLSSQDIGVVTVATELLSVHGAVNDRVRLRHNLESLEAFLRRFLNCWN